MFSWFISSCFPFKFKFNVGLQNTRLDTHVPPAFTRRQSETIREKVTTFNWKTNSGKMKVREKGRKRLTWRLMEERQRLKQTTESNLARGREHLRWNSDETWNVFNCKHVIGSKKNSTNFFAIKKDVSCKCFIGKQASYAVTTQNCHLPGHCASLSVRGTYTTPIRGVRATDPSAFLSICSSCWLPPSGPTGTIKRPPGFNCAMS